MESLKYKRTDIDETRRFLDVLAERDRLLVVLFQFPVSFKFTCKDKEGAVLRLEGNWDHVVDVLNAFKEYPKAIEFRHESWDDPWVLSALREHGTAWVNIDEPRLGASTARAPRMSPHHSHICGSTDPTTRSGSIRKAETNVTITSIRQRNLSRLRNP